VVDEVRPEQEMYEMIGELIDMTDDWLQDSDYLKEQRTSLRMLYGTLEHKPYNDVRRRRLSCCLYTIGNSARDSIGLAAYVVTRQCGRMKLFALDHDLIDTARRVPFTGMTAEDVINGQAAYLRIKINKKRRRTVIARRRKVRHSLKALPS
jgi:hypothetical protein